LPFISRLSKEDLKSIVVPAPPISKQKELVTEFQKQRKKIESMERELERAKKNLLKIKFSD
jgi:restriction endonuclease S subunit